MHPLYGLQQQWSPYQQQPYAPPVTYVQTTTVYGGHAPPPGQYPFNQWSNSNQYKPPGFTPCPAASNPPWGQPGTPIPHQQSPFTGNQVRQGAPSRQPQPGFVSEESETTASSSNTGVGSLPKRPGTSQIPLETSENPAASEVPLALGVAQRPKTSASAVASRPPLALRPTERPRTAIATVLPGEIQGLKLAERPTTLMNTVASIPQESRLTGYPTRSSEEVSTSATSPSSRRTIKPSTTTSCGSISHEEEAELLSFVAQRRALREGNVIQPSSARPHAPADHELYEPKEIAKPTLHTGSKEAPKQTAPRNDPIVHVISDSPRSSVSSSPLPSEMHVDRSLLSGHTLINGSVRQREVSPLYNNRKRMTPSHFESEDESQEQALQKDLPAAKQVQHTEQQKPSQPDVSSVTKRGQPQKRIQDEPLQPHLRRSTRATIDPSTNYRDITPRAADAMMLSPQDTSIMRQITSHAEPIGDESSFHRGVADAVKLDRRSLRKRIV